MCFTILVLFFLFCSIYLFHSVFMYFLFFLLVCWIDTNRLPLFFSNNVMWNVNIYQYLKTMAMHTVFGWFILWSEEKVSHQPFYIMYLYQHSTFSVSPSKVCLFACLLFLCLYVYIIYMCIWYTSIRVYRIRLNLNPVSKNRHRCVFWSYVHFLSTNPETHPKTRPKKPIFACSRKCRIKHLPTSTM